MIKLSLIKAYVLKMSTVAFVILSANAVRADDVSIVTVPISVPLNGLQAFANAEMPNPIHEKRGREICVKAERACTKIPEFRGFKIYSRMECIDVSPNISCDLHEKVWGEGPLELDESNGELVLSQRISAAATVRGRGSIGKHIKETARGAADVTIRARPHIAPNWDVTLALSHDLRWTQKPNVVLFNVFRVTFEGEANKALNRGIAKFKANKLPEALRKLRLRERAAPLWDKLQQPHEIELEDHSLFLHFLPQKIGIGSIEVSRADINTVVSIAGRTQVTDSDARPFLVDKAPLPDLSPVPGAPGFSLSVPVSVELQKLEAALGAELPREFDTDTPLGKITVRSALLSERAGRLTIDAEIRSTIHDGPLSISGVPVWDEASQTLDVREISVSTGNAFKDLGIAVLRYWLEPQSKIALGREIDRAEVKFNEALNRSIDLDGRGQIQLTGSGELTASDLQLAGGRVEIVAKTTGTLSVEGLKLQ